MPPCSPMDEMTKQGGKAPHEPSLTHGSSSAPQPEAPQGPFTPCSQLSREGFAAGRQPCSPPTSTFMAPLISSLALPQPQDHTRLGQAPGVQLRHKKKKNRPSELPASERGNLLTSLFTVGAEVTLNTELWSQLARLDSAGALLTQHQGGTSGPASSLISSWSPL